MCLNARNIIYKKTNYTLWLNDINPHIICITESWPNKYVTDAELGLEWYLMFRKDRMGRRGGGLLFYVKYTIPSYEVQLRDEADCKEAVWCKLVAGHKNSSHGTSLPLSKHNKREQ